MGEHLEDLWRTVNRKIIPGALVRTFDNDVSGYLFAQCTFMSGETYEDIYLPQNYGFMSRPLDIDLEQDGSNGAKVIAGFVRDNDGYALIVDDRRFKITLQKGEVAMHDDLGNLIHFKRDRLAITSAPGLPIELTSDTNVLITAPLTDIQGNVNIDGDITHQGNNVHTGNYNITGDITLMGNYTQTAGNMMVTGNVDIVGPLDVTGTIAASGNISTPLQVFAALIGLSTHTHTSTGPNAETTGPNP